MVERRWAVERWLRPTAGQAAAVRALARSAGGRDGIVPLNDEALLALGAAAEPDAADTAETDRPGAHFAVGKPAGGLAGYAYLGVGDAAQVAVAPDQRRQGVGAALAQAIRAAAPAAEFWAFGDLPPARAFAQRHGAQPVRELWQMSRRLAPPPAAPAPGADGVVIRPYRPADAGALVDLNARAFAHHPEQGRWTRADLDARVAADWFDAAGLLIAEAAAAGRLVGFHWTKVHAADHPRPDAAPSAVAMPRGEVYVLAVDPDWSGRGLGRHLLDAGLAHLAAQGLDEVFLHVEGDQARAVRLYRNAGFSVVRRDIRYAAERAAEPAGPGARRGGRPGGGSAAAPAGDWAAKGKEEG